MGGQFVSLQRAWPATVLGLLLPGCSPEPRYQSRPASFWLKELTEDTASRRYHAAHALGEMGPSVKGAVPALRQALTDPNHLVRYEAALALDKFGPAARDALPDLRERLQDSERAVREVAEAAVKSVGQPPDERSN